MDVLMGLLAAFFWGATDFLVGVNARAVGVHSAVLFGQVLGLLIMCSILIFFGGYSTLLEASSTAIYLGILASIFTVVGALSISKAFKIGKTAVVAPLVSSYGVFTTLLAWFGGENITITQFIGISICVAGVLFTSSKRENSNSGQHKDSGPAVFFAMLAALLYGSSFWIQGKYALPSLGPVIMLWLGYIVGVFFLLPRFLGEASAFKVNRPPINIIVTLCSASIFNLAGFAAFSWGALYGSISIVTVISTLSGGIAAVLGFLLYKEKLSPVQILGIFFVLGGAVILHTHLGS